jgi:hypothetical protein
MHAYLNFEILISFAQVAGQKAARPSIVLTASSPAGPPNGCMAFNGADEPQVRSKDERQLLCCCFVKS